MRVQEIAEPSQTLDELRQLAVELNRRLGLVGHGGGPANGFYPAQPAEQGMPSAVRPNSNPFPMAQRPVDEGTPSVVRLSTIQTPISKSPQEMPMARPIAISTASILMELQSLAHMSQRL